MRSAEIVIVVALFVGVAIGTWFERGRAGGTDHMRRQRDNARRACDHARAQRDTALAELDLVREHYRRSLSADHPVGRTRRPESRLLQLVHGGEQTS